MKKFIRYYLIMGILGIGVLFINIPPVFAVDISIVYSGKDRQLKENLEEELEKVFSTPGAIRSFNVDVLVLEDYSGKQKVIAKISRAKVVVLIKDSPEEMLDNVLFSTMVKVYDGSAEDVAKIVEKMK